MKSPRFFVPLILAFAALAGPPASFAATYYVSPSGDDTRTTTQAQNIATPWKTIQKAATNMIAGDTCNIRAGTYRETVTVPVTGTSAAPITFQAYGSEVVTISGTEPLSGWALESTNIYYAPMAWTLADGNQVFQSNAMKPEARWPNAGPGYPWQNSSVKPSTDWAYFDTVGYTNNTAGWFTDAALPSRADGYWIGATVHAMGGHGWIMQFPTVTAYTDATRTVVTNDGNGANSAYVFSIGNEYYLTGKKGELDSAGEWFYDSTNSRMYFYSSTTPANVEAKKRTYGFDLRGKAYIKLTKLGFQACTVQMDSGSTNETFDGLTMKYLGQSRKNSSTFGLQLYSNSVLRNSELAWDSRGLVRLIGSDIRVINNHLHDSGYVPTWDAMVDGGGYRNLVSHNSLHDSGRAAFGSAGRGAIIEYNDMHDAMRLTTDGAVFYTYLEAGNTIVRYNLFHDSPGPVGHSGHLVEGFYLDSQNSNWVVHHNLIWNVPGYGMQFNARHNYNMVFNNTVRAATAGSITTGFTQDGDTGTHIYNNLFNTIPKGTQSVWSLTDFRYNLYSDPSFVSGTSRLQSTSPAINAGTVIAGITDGYNGAAPDLGALEYGGTDWTPNAGYNTTPPSPDPTYSMPGMVFANRVKDGSFESGALAPNWTTIGSSIAVYNVPGVTAWTDVRFRTGAYDLKFTQGTSEVKQSLTGLQAGHAYKLYVGVQTADPTAVVKIGVRNHGYSALETTTPVGSGAWAVTDLPFILGTASTSAEIYVNVISSSATLPVYVDDIGVAQALDDVDPQPYDMPVVSYPFDETSGTTAFDTTTHAINATLTNTTFVAGNRGNALAFNGTSSQGSVNLGGTASPGGSFSVAFWIKFDDSGTGTPPLASNNNNGWLKKGWYICANQNRAVGMYLWTKDNSTGTDSPPTGTSAWTGNVPINTWTHVGFTIDRANATFTRYRNGLAESTSAIPAGFADIDTTLGLKLGSTSLKGQMDDFQTWNYALSADEMNAAAFPDANVALRLKLDDATGSAKAWDATGLTHHGVLTSMNPATCWVDGALQFSAAGYVQAPQLTTATWPGGSFTVSFWAKFDDSGTGTPALVSNNNGGWLKKGWYITANEGRSIGLYLWTKDNGSGGDTPPSAMSSWTGAVPVGTWAHIAYVVDRENSALSRYRNGVLENVATIPVGFADLGTLLGARIGSPSLRGQLDDVRLYNRALKPIEVLGMARHDSPPYY